LLDILTNAFLNVSGMNQHRSGIIAYLIL